MQTLLGCKPLWLWTHLLMLHIFAVSADDNSEPLKILNSAFHTAKGIPTVYFNYLENICNIYYVNHYHILYHEKHTCLQKLEFPGKSWPSCHKSDYFIFKSSLLQCFVLWSPTYLSRKKYSFAVIWFCCSYKKIWFLTFTLSSSKHPKILFSIFLSNLHTTSSQMIWLMNQCKSAMSITAFRFKIK